MKKLTIAASFMLLLASCAKEQIKPLSVSPEATEIEGTEKEATKRKLYCNVMAADGTTILLHGTKCVYQGDECGRSANCTARIGGKIIAPEEVIFEGRTRGELAEMWEDDEGRAWLMEQGFYEVELP